MKLKRVLSAVIAASLTLSLSACAGSKGSSDAASGGGNAESSSSQGGAVTTVDDDIENPVDVSDISIDPGLDTDEVEPADLRYLGNYDITTAGDIKPSYKYFKENYGCTITCEIVSS